MYSAVSHLQLGVGPQVQHTANGTPLMCCPHSQAGITWICYTYGQATEVEKLVQDEMKQKQYSPMRVAASHFTRALKLYQTHLIVQ